MKYFIWSFEHGAWWKRGRFGYTTEAAEAGVFDYETAMQIVINANGYGDINEAMVPVPLNTKLKRPAMVIDKQPGTYDKQSLYAAIATDKETNLNGIVAIGTELGFTPMVSYDQDIIFGWMHEYKEVAAKCRDSHTDSIAKYTFNETLYEVKPNAN